MGRPLNKKFFGDPVGGGFQVACLADVGAGNVTAHIVQQKSNLRYVVAETATPANTATCKLQAATPSAPGQMRVEVQGENAQTPTTADIGFTSAGGTGALLTVFVDNVAAHYGYWSNGTNVAIAGVTDGTVDYTVDGSGKIATVSINTAGSANTQAGSPVALADAALANPPLQYARIINARTVKTFEGSTFAWPAVGGDGSGGRGPFTEADLQGS